MNKIAVYTCITGNYDNLLEISEKSDKIDYICFTDNKNLKSASWKIKYFSEIDGFGILKNEITSVKKQRLIKILSHKFLSEYDTTLWVDANIKIQHNLYDFITSFDLEKCPIYTNKHPTRNCLYQEVLAVVKLKKDKYENIRPQVLRYKSEKYPVNNGMAETNIILRNNKDLRNHLLELKWAKEILQGSHRDQLSFDYVIWKNKLSYSHLNIQYRFTKENDLFHLIKHNRSTLPYSQDFIKSSLGIQKEKNDENSSQVLKIEKTSNELPILNVVITTHNRTVLATTVIESLIKNLKYSGKIQYIISDDRSEIGHIWALIDKFNEYKIFDVIICKTSENHYGLGASLNNGIRKAFEFSDIVLTTEDDLILKRTLDLDIFVKKILEPNIAGIKLCRIDKYYDKDQLDKNGDFYIIHSTKNTNTNFPFIWNFQAMLRHKRAFDMLGYYDENIDANQTERNAVKKYSKFTENGKNKKLQVLWYDKIDFCDKAETFYFDHAGKTLVKNFKNIVPSKYEYLNNEDNDIEYRKKFEVTVAITSYPARYESLKLTINSIINQCDRLCVCLNEFDSIPNDFPKNDKISVVLANNTSGIADLGCQNKMLFAGNFDGYYLTIDDDIIYPDNYVLDLVQNINKYNKEAICSYHGKEYSINKGQINFTIPPKLYWFMSKHIDTYVHQVGMGVAGFYPSKIGLTKEEFIKFPKNTGDDEITAIFAQRNNIKLICVDNSNINFKQSIYDKINGLCRNKDGVKQRKLFLNTEYNKWKEIFFFKIIIPVYNSGELLKRAVNSILNQTFNNYKIIIVDDKSTDNSRDIIDSIKSNKIEKIFLNENSGGGGARNAALSANVDSQYILFLDSDDYFIDKNVLENIYQTIISNNFPDFIRLSFLRELENKSNFTLKFSSNDSVNRIIAFEAPWAACVKTMKNKPFVANRRRFNDVVWFLRTADNCDTYAVCDKICVHYKHDNKFSVQRTHKDHAYFESLKLLADDLEKEFFKKKICNERKEKIIKEKRLKYAEYLKTINK